MKNLTVDTKEQSPGAFVVTLVGPLDTYTHETLEFYIEKILAPTTHTIVFDMSGVDYISSMGIGSIFKVRKAAKEHKFDFRMVGVQVQVDKVMKTVQAMPAEALFESVEELDAYLTDLQNKNKE